MITKKEMQHTITVELRSLHKQKYQQELACRAFKATEQSEQLDYMTKALMKTQEMIDFYEDEMKKLNADETKA